MTRVVEDSQQETSCESSMSDSGSSVSRSVPDYTGLGGNMLVTLTEDNQEHILLKHKFYSSLKSAAKHCSVVSAYRIANSTSSAKARLEAFQLYSLAVMDKRDGNPNVQMAWYGTTSNEMDHIIQHGFKISRSTQDRGLYGCGVYLSSQSSVIDSIVSATPDANGLRHVLMCRAILGNMEEVPLGSKQCRPSSLDFDSGVDNKSLPSKHIIWPLQLETHILPLYVLCIRVDFASRVPQDEPVKKPSSPCMSVAALISRVSGCLPPSRSCLIKKFYNAYVERKITRQQLINQLRLFIGDKLLISTLKSAGLRK